MSLTLPKNEKKFQILAAVDLCAFCDTETRIAIATPKMIQRCFFGNIGFGDKTNILLDKNGKFVAFGSKATDIWYQQRTMPYDDDSTDDNSDAYNTSDDSSYDSSDDGGTEYMYFESFTKNLYCML